MVEMDQIKSSQKERVGGQKKEKWKKVEYSNSWILLLKKVNTEMECINDLVEKDFFRLNIILYFGTLLCSRDTLCPFNKSSVLFSLKLFTLL